MNTDPTTKPKSFANREGFPQPFFTAETRSSQRSLLCDFFLCGLCVSAVRWRRLGCSVFIRVHLWFRSYCLSSYAFWSRIALSTNSPIFRSYPLCLGLGV